MLNFKNMFSLCFVITAIISIIFLYDVIILLTTAYLISLPLNKIIKRLSPKIGNNLAITLVFCLFWGAVVTALSIIMPMAYDQVELFVKTIPKYKAYIQENFMPLLMQKVQNVDKSIIEKLSAPMEQGSDKILGFAFTIITSIWNYTRGTIHFIIFLVLLPIFNFYIIKDGKTLSTYAQRVKEALDPRITSFIKECCQVILQFLQGLINVCLIMATYYSIFFTLAGVDFSLLLGIVSGFAVAIPFAGFFTALLLSSIITIFHFGIDHHLMYVLFIYFIGQGLEGYLVTPRIVGDKIGLTPLLMILALVCWGKLFGVIGLFIAIPMTCVLKVVFKNILEAKA